MILIHSWPVRIASGLILVGGVFIASAAAGTTSAAAAILVVNKPLMVPASLAKDTVVDKAAVAQAPMVAVTPSPGAPASTAATPGTPGQLVVAAIVNGKTLITIAQLDAEVNRQLDARASLNDPPPADLNSFRDSVLNSLIQQALIEQTLLLLETLAVLPGGAHLVDQLQHQVVGGSGLCILLLHAVQQRFHESLKITGFHWQKVVK